MSEINSNIAVTNTGFIRIRASAFMDNGRIAYRYTLYGNGEFNKLDFSTNSAAELAQITASGNNLILPNGTLVKISGPPGASAVAATIREQAPSIQQYLTAGLESDLAKREAAAKPAPVPTPAPTPTPTPTTTAKPASVAAPTTPAPAVVAKTTATPATTSDPSKPTANANAATTTTTSKPPPIAVTKEPLNDIVINTAPITVPTIDVKTGKTTGNTTINLAPITIPGEKLALPPAETGNTAPAAGPPAAGLTAGITTAAGGASAQDLANFTARADWRVRLALAPESKYLYNNQNNAGILAPLQKTDGVIFPYTPAINVSYAAQYDPTKLTHSNYTMFQYTSSSVDSVSITCDFTAQDVFEANYMLAVIHFFRSMTKMFYGQDSDPKNGTPPPLCYLYGLGGFQFDALPLAINGFNYVLPQDVDYIKTTGPAISVNAPATSPSSNSITNVIASFQRLGKALKPGGKAAAPNYENTPVQNSDTTTWVPTKINLSISCVPIMSRNAVSNRFSLTEYANGTLLRGTRDGAQGGGFW